MKILFIAPYRQNDEWGDSSRNYIQSLLLTGHDITIRPIFFGNTKITELAPELEKSEKKRHKKYDVLIQKVLPHALTYNGNFDRNIALCTTESRYGLHKWMRQINMMDDVWVTSKHQENLLGALHDNISVIGCPIPTDIFNEEFEPLDIPEAQETFNFYYIGEHSERSNITALIIAFHSAFRRSDNVRLILNTNASRDDIHALITDIKKRLRIYANENCYKKDIIITPLVDSKAEPKLHTLGDCFILPSCGEAFQKFAVNAAGFNNIVITSDCMSEIPGAICIQSQDAIPCVSNPPLPDLYTANEIWEEISTEHLMGMMQYAYYHHSDISKFTQAVKDKYSYQAIADSINEALK